MAFVGAFGFLDDTSGNGRTLSAGSAASLNKSSPASKWVEGREFTGLANQTLTRTDNAFDVAGGDFAFVLVCEELQNPDIAEFNNLVSYGTETTTTTASSWGLVSLNAGNQVRFYMNGSNYNLPNNSFESNTLYRITVRYVGGTLVIKKNEVTEINTSATGASDPGGVFCIGGMSDGAAATTFHGGIYAFSLWSGASTPSQATLDSIASTAGTDAPEGNEVAHYRMRNDSPGFVETHNANTTWVAPTVASDMYIVVDFNAQAYGPGGNGGDGNLLALQSGGGGGGGGFGQINDYAITPGNSYAIVVGAGGSETNSSFDGAACVGGAGLNGESASGLVAGSPGDGGAGGTGTGDVTNSGGAGAGGDGLNEGAGGGGAGDSANGTAASGTTAGSGGASDGGNGGSGAGGNGSPIGGGAAGGNTLSTGGGSGADGIVYLNYKRLFTVERQEPRLYTDDYMRVIDRLQEDIQLFSDTVRRSLIKRLQSDERLFEHINTSRNITRTQREQYFFEDVATRNISRIQKDMEEFTDSVTRSLSRVLGDNRHFDDDDFRHITRVHQDVRKFEDSYSRVVGRYHLDDLNYEDFRTLRSISREGEEEKLFDLTAFIRSILRELVEARRFDDDDYRHITRLIQDTRIFEDKDVLRSITKVDEDFRHFMDDLFKRVISREPQEDRLFDFEFRSIQRRADFPGYAHDKALLERHGHEWLKEHYGPYIMQILNRILEIVIESDEFSG